VAAVTNDLKIFLSERERATSSFDDDLLVSDEKDFM
jgi:hypothetical protein